MAGYPEVFTVESIAGEDVAVLRISARELELDMRDDFLRASHELVGCREGLVVVDMSRLSNVPSLFVGGLVDLSLRAEKTGKKFAVIAGPVVAATLRAMSLDKRMDIREAPWPKTL